MVAGHSSGSPDQSTEHAAYIGCAGWSLSSAAQLHFPEQGSHLERYAAVFNAVEINSSFYRPHRPATYARWRASVPASFRFSVKMPRTITHQLRLQNCDDALLRFLEEAGHLEEKFGCLLVQLPPSLQFDETVAIRFFDMLRSRTNADLVCEARHRSWFGSAADTILDAFHIARVKADPMIVECDADSHANIMYARLHGSPVIYHSTYSDAYLNDLSHELRDHLRNGRRTAWCIFDNTASGAAIPNALSLQARIATW